MCSPAATVVLYRVNIIDRLKFLLVQVMLLGVVLVGPSPILKVYKKMIQPLVQEL
jgi:hypothetical protein